MPEREDGGDDERRDADAFCKAQGYARALAFANGMEKVPAETLASQRCATLECNVFSKIECVR